MDDPSVIVLPGMREVSKAFGATRALEDVSMVVDAVEVRAPIGENAAGKNTPMKLCGEHRRIVDGALDLLEHPDILRATKVRGF